MPVVELSAEWLVAVAALHVKSAATLSSELNEVLIPAVPMLKPFSVAPLASMVVLASNYCQPAAGSRAKIIWCGDFKSTAAVIDIAGKCDGA